MAPPAARPGNLRPVPLCPVRREQGTCGPLVFSFPSLKNLEHTCNFPVTLLAGVLAVGVGMSSLEPLSSAGVSPRSPELVGELGREPLAPRAVLVTRSGSSPRFFPSSAFWLHPLHTESDVWFLR